jgi:hypothetical protein
MRPSRVSSQSPATVTVTVSRTVTSPAKPEPKPAKPPQIARPSSLKTFPGKYFSVEYPGAWYVDTAETDKGSYLDTTIRNGHNPEVMVRVDVTPATAATAATDRLVSARRLEDALRLQPDYRRLELRRFTFHGLPAVRWEFEVTEDHVLLHKSRHLLHRRRGRRRRDPHPGPSLNVRPLATAVRTDPRLASTPDRDSGSHRPDHTGVAHAVDTSPTAGNHPAGCDVGD